jgi:hypothetical protein
VRYLRFDADGPREAVLADAERLLDVAAAGRAEEHPPWYELDDRALQRVVRAAPPTHALRRLERVRILAPCVPGRVVLQGGLVMDATVRAIGPGDDLPAGPWSTGVAAVMRPFEGPVRPSRWLDHVAGFVPFHLVGDVVAVGPWIVGTDEASDALKLAFSAFVDDVPHIRPAKALLDWGRTLVEAHAAKPLAAGDLVGIAAPPRTVEAGQRLRAAFVYDGAVVARLENPVGQAAPDVGAAARGHIDDEPAQPEAHPADAPLADDLAGHTEAGQAARQEAAHAESAEADDAHARDAGALPTDPRSADDEPTAIPSDPEPARQKADPEPSPEPTAPES